MKTLGAAFVSALVVFTLATVWADYVQPRLEILANASAANSLKATGKGKQSAKADLQSDDDADAESENVVPVATKSRKARRAAEEAEQRAEANREITAKLEELKAREAKLAEREDALNTIHAEIRREMARVEELQRRATAAPALVDTRAIERTDTAASAKATKSAAATKQKADSDSRIAAVVLDLAKRGNEKDAAAFLSGFKERDAARILNALNASNPVIASKLTDQIRTAKLQKSSAIQ